MPADNLDQYFEANNYHAPEDSGSIKVATTMLCINATLPSSAEEPCRSCG